MDKNCRYCKTALIVVKFRLGKDDKAALVCPRCDYIMGWPRLAELKPARKEA